LQKNGAFAGTRAVTHVMLWNHMAEAMVAPVAPYWGGHMGMHVLLWKTCSSFLAYAWQVFVHAPLPSQLQSFIQAAI